MDADNVMRPSILFMEEQVSCQGVELNKIVTIIVMLKDC